MSWKLTGIVSHKITGSPIRRLVLMTMCDKANDDGSGVYASFATIAQDCELSRATAKRIIKEFEQEQLIKQVGTRPCASGETNDYTVNVAALKALPDIQKRKNPGSQRTGVTANRGHEDPGLQSKPGSERTPTRVTVTPKPILEPESVVVAVRGTDLLPALKERADGAINLTSGHVHHAGELSRLLRGGCIAEDLENATDAITASFKAKGRLFSSWAIISELAIENRDRRLAGVPPPAPPTSRPAARAGRPDSSAIISRVAAEMGVK